MATRRPRKNAPAVPEVSQDDLALFEREVEGARRLDRDGSERVRVPPPGKLSESRGLPAVARSAEVGPGVQGSSESRGRRRPAAAEAEDDGDATLDAYVAPGVDRRELRKLRRGDYTPDVRLDLHGLMATEAVARVTRVLDGGPGRRPRCLCVVHGRGLHSPDNVPVLKLRVRACLRAHPAVLAFADAPKHDGGQGAVYVLLRR